MTKSRNEHVHRKDLTFRQAERVDPIPKMLAFGELDSKLRNLIWDVVYQHFSHELDHYTPGRFSDLGYKVATLVLREVSNFPLDEAKAIAWDASKVFNHLKEIVLCGQYYDCLELVQFLARSRTWSNFEQSMRTHALDSSISPYTFIDFPPLTIVPRGDSNERKDFEANWKIIDVSGFGGAKTHLRESAEALNRGDSAGAIREAIHAVEGAAKLLSGKPNATLNDALSVLKKDKGLNSVLGEAFGKLYGYTSSEKGIRHALTEAGEANVGVDEALFMFSACTAFVGYLVRRYPEI